MIENTLKNREEVVNLLAYFAYKYKKNLYFVTGLAFE